MRILVSGSSGLIGTALCRSLRDSGHTVVRIVRRPVQGDSEVYWDGVGLLDPRLIEGADAFVHLSGRNIADKRWNKKFKQELEQSRVDTTRRVVDAFAKCANPPKVFLSASAVGFYGSRGDEILTESAAAGTGFFPDLCEKWERASKGINARHCVMRFGVVLSPEGGAIKKMITPFRLGLGGELGSGKQVMPWVSIVDAVRAIEFLLTNESASGPVNITAPNPVANSEFTRALAQAVHRPAIFPMPAAVARLAFGEMADEALLASARVVPEKLKSLGFKFRHETIDAALKELLG